MIRRVQSLSAAPIQLTHQGIPPRLYLSGKPCPEMSNQFRHLKTRSEYKLEKSDIRIDIRAFDLAEFGFWLGSLLRHMGCIILSTKPVTS